MLTSSFYVNNLEEELGLQEEYRVSREYVDWSVNLIVIEHLLLYDKLCFQWPPTRFGGGPARGVPEFEDTGCYSSRAYCLGILILVLILILILWYILTESQPNSGLFANTRSA